MPRPTDKRIKIQRHKPTLDLEEFNALTDLLFEACKEQNKLCADMLDIDTRTWKKWTHTPPTQWWWNHVLRLTVKQVLSQMVAHRKRSITGKFRKGILDALSRIPRAQEFEAEIAAMAYEAKGCERWLRDLLTPRGKKWSYIKQQGNLDGYSKAMLQVAGKNIGVVKSQQGYGDNKESFWRLPNEDDDD